MNCDICHQEIPKPKYSFTTGYARDDRNRVVCYTCCADLDRQWMSEKGQITLYLSGDDKVTNWPGSLCFPAVVFEGKHNWRGVKQLYAYFVGPDDQPWYGRCVTGGFTEIVRCRRIQQFPNHAYRGLQYPDLVPEVSI